MRSVGLLYKILSGVPRVVYVTLPFLLGDVEKVLVSSYVENDCDLPLVGLQQIDPLSN